MFQQHISMGQNRIIHSMVTWHSVCPLHLFFGKINMHLEHIQLARLLKKVWLSCMAITVQNHIKDWQTEGCNSVLAIWGSWCQNIPCFQNISGTIRTKLKNCPYYRYSTKTLKIFFLLLFLMVLCKT